MSSDDICYLGTVQIDPAIWRTTVPLIVLERCDSPQLLCTWIALRWLTALYPDQRGFSRAEIARRGYMSARRVTYQSVNGEPAWVDTLIARGLVQDLGTENIPGLNPRRCYGLPLHELEAASIDRLPAALFAYGAAPVALKPGNENAALWRPDLPLAVLEGCDNPQMIATWLALRWLHAIHPTRASFTSLEVARRGNINQKYIYGKCKDGSLGWADRLIANGLLRDDGTEPSRANLNPRRRTIVPLVELEAASQVLLLPVLRAWNVDPRPTITQPANQLMLNLDAVEIGGHTLHIPVAASQERTIPTAGAGAAAPEAAQVRTQAARAESSCVTVIAGATTIPEAPPSVQGWPQIVVSPEHIWKSARERVGETDVIYLAGLAGDHNETTNGYGWWYVAQAILDASSKESINLRTSATALSYIKGTLKNWRKQQYRGTASRGSDNEQIQQAQPREASRRTSAEQCTTPGRGTDTAASARTYTPLTFDDDESAT